MLSFPFISARGVVDFMTMAPRLRVTLAALALVLALPVAGCALGRWEVVHAGPKAAFVKQSRFMAVPLEFRQLQIGDVPEEEYLASKDPETRAAHVQNKVELAKAFAISLATECASRNIEVVDPTVPPTSPFLLRLYVRKLEPGFYAFVAARPASLEGVLLITDLGGVVYDEVVFTVTEPTTAFNTRSGRFAKLAERLASYVADYLQERTSLP